MRFIQVDSKLCKSLLQRVSNWYHLYREHYDLIYEFPNNNLTSKWLLRAFCAEKIVAMNEIVPKGVPRYRFLLNFLAENGIPHVEKDEVFDWKFTQEETLCADAWFRNLSFPNGWMPFAMCVGGKNKLQHWPIERYAKILSFLVECHFFPLIFGSYAERYDVENLLAMVGTGMFIHNLSSLSLREKILVMKKCAFYIGNDTGPMHLAGVAGIPIIVICSARAPRNYWHPLSKRVLTLTADVPCQECRATICPMGNPAPCINSIMVETVMSKTISFLKEPFS